MKAMVVYESLYGNTAAIGEAIAKALTDHGLDVRVGPDSRIQPAETSGVDLLVVGGPTHAHGMSWTGTRRTAATDKKNPYPEPTAEPGLREWMNRLPPGRGRLGAAFDTRFDKAAAITGSAARGIARRLEAHGFRAVLEPESFFVTGDNHLQASETERAATWGAALAEGCASRAGGDPRSTV
jgi:hypothetical protein